MNIQPFYWDCRNDSKGRRAALFSQTRGIEVQRASFLSWLVALCTSRFIIALLNEGYDIPPPLYWQDLDSFPVQKSIIHNKISCVSKHAECTASVRTKERYHIYENKNMKFSLLCLSYNEKKKQKKKQVVAL